jgi:8-oxo-dGTP pyrophosphatase MutT (NUDIX family)
VTSVINSVAAIIIDEKSRVLLQKRDGLIGIYYPGFWGLFGGAMDQSELPINAITREIQEEIGLGSLEFEYFLEFEFACPLFDGLTHRRIVFIAMSEEYVLQSLKLNEGSCKRLFAFDELPPLANLVSFDAAILSMYLNLSVKKQQLSPKR